MDVLSRLPCNQCGHSEHQAVAHILQAPEDPPHQPEMRKLLQGNPDISAVLKAEEKQAKPDADEQKAQSLEIRWLCSCGSS